MAVLEEPVACIAAKVIGVIMELETSCKDNARPLSNESRLWKSVAASWARTDVEHGSLDKVKSAMVLACLAV